jgi:hypothetical protein
MRDENLDLIVRNMFLPAESKEDLTEKQKDLLEQVTDCYHQQMAKPMISRTKLRAYLTQQYGISKTQAYKIIQYAAVALGDVRPSHKNWIRQRIEYLTEQAYEAIEAKNYKRFDALNKLAATLSKAFATNMDEGELINAQKYLEIDMVKITIDPSVLGVKFSETKQKDIEKMLRKYEIEDAEIIPPEEDKE